MVFSQVLYFYLLVGLGMGLGMGLGRVESNFSGKAEIPNGLSSASTNVEDDELCYVVLLGLRVL